MSSKSLQKLKAGDFNDMSQEWQSDDTVIITLVKRGEGKIYRFCVKDMYGDNEEVLWEEIKEVR